MPLEIYSKFKPQTPHLIWDGKCGFCKYWVIKWKKLTANKVRYIPFQQIHDQIEELSEQDFKEAVRLIETDGQIYSGAHAAYRTLHYSSRWAFLLSWYQKFTLFKKLSDSTYQLIANNRPALYKLTKTFFGKNP